MSARAGSAEPDPREHNPAALAISWLEQGRRCEFLLAAAIALYAAVFLWIGRGTTLFLDETNVFELSRGYDLDSLLAPLNGHLVLVFRLVYAINFDLFGPEFLAVRLIVIAGAGLAAGLFFALVKTRVGPVPALAATTLLLFLGSAWEILFIQSGITHVWSVAGGLGALFMLERGGRRAELIACGALIVSIASFTFGVAFAIGTAVLLALQRRRDGLWVALVPLGLFAAWLVWSRAIYSPVGDEVEGLQLDNLLLIPNFAANEAASVAGALAGLNYDFAPGDVFAAFATDSVYGGLIAAVAAVGLVIAIRRRGATPMLWALVVILVAIWAALALGFGDGRSPTTARYVYVGAVVVLLIGAEACRGLRMSRSIQLAVVGVVVLALGANIARLRDGADFYRSLATGLRAQLAAVEIARDTVDPGFSAGEESFNVVPADRYMAAVDRIGSPAYSPNELAEQSERVRAQADATLIDAERIALTPSAPSEGLLACRPLAPAERSPVAFEAGPPGVVLSAKRGATVSLRRFADATTVSVGELPAGEPQALSLPADRARQPWVVVVTAAGPVAACDLPPG